jgi:hypothetical protein
MEATIAISKSEDSASGSSDSGSNEQTGHHGNVGVGDSREQVVVSPASGGERFSLDGSSPEPTAAAAPKPAQPTTALDARPIAGPKTVNQLALEVGSGNDIVRIQAQQNAGTLRVAVHSPNADLAPHLNERLPELMKQLDLRGFDSRVVAAQSPMRSVEVGQSHSHSSGGFDQHSNDTPRDHQQNRRRSRSQGWDDLVMQLHYE